MPGNQRLQPPALQGPSTAAPNLRAGSDLNDLARVKFGRHGCCLTQSTAQGKEGSMPGPAPWQVCCARTAAFCLRNEQAKAENATKACMWRRVRCQGSGLCAIATCGLDSSEASQPMTLFISLSQTQVIKRTLQSSVSGSHCCRSIAVLVQAVRCPGLLLQHPGTSPAAFTHDDSLQGLAKLQRVLKLLVFHAGGRAAPSPCAKLLRSDASHPVLDELPSRATPICCAAAHMKTGTQVQ